MPVLTMAVDLGTSFIKAGVYNTDGKCFGIVKEPVKAETPSAGTRAGSQYRSVDERTEPADI